MKNLSLNTSDEFIWDATREMHVDLKEIEYPELVAFRNTLKYLVNQKYNAKVEVAKKFFDGSYTT